MKKSRLFYLLLVMAVPLHGQVFTAPPISVAINKVSSYYPQTAYNPHANEYLVVWEDFRNVDSDIYGQFITADGLPRGDNFPILRAENYQWAPHVDFDPVNQRFLVVFNDYRNTAANSDIRGVFVNADGSFFDAPGALSDHSFPICTHSASVGDAAVAFNTGLNRFLVVWGNDRRDDPLHYNLNGGDVYGQLINADGTLAAPADPAVNLKIAANPAYWEHAVDVAESGIREFLVVFNTGDGYIKAQRVRADGVLLRRTGQVLAGGAEDPLQVSEKFTADPWTFVPNVQANRGGGLYRPAWEECLVVWRGRKTPDGTSDDIWGQRIHFLRTGSDFRLRPVNLSGDSTGVRSNFPISLAPGDASTPEVAFSFTGNEFMVMWADPRYSSALKTDLYGQRLRVDLSSRQMSFIAHNGVSTVTEFENINYFSSTDKYEGSGIGLAWDSVNNRFFSVFEYYDPANGRFEDIMGFFVNGSLAVTDVAERPTAPSGYALSGNYPNPFNQSTRIDLELPATTEVSAGIYDVRGRLIQTLFSGFKSAGRHTLSWDGRDADGNDMPTGVYYAEVSTSDRQQVIKLALVR